MRTIRSKIWCVKLLRVAIINGPNITMARPIATIFGRKDNVASLIWVKPALRAVVNAAARGNEKAYELATYWVGQCVGLVDSVKSCRTVVQEFMEEFAEAVEELQALAEG